MPDNDPMDNCSYESHGNLIYIDNLICVYIICIGTHVAGIIGANTTGITSGIFMSNTPFIGVAPQATLGACKFT